MPSALGSAPSKVSIVKETVSKTKETSKEKESSRQKEKDSSRETSRSRDPRHEHRSREHEHRSKERPREHRRHSKERESTSKDSPRGRDTSRTKITFSETEKKLADKNKPVERMDTSSHKQKTSTPKSDVVSDILRGSAYEQSPKVLLKRLELPSDHFSDSTPVQDEPRGSSSELADRVKASLERIEKEKREKERQEKERKENEKKESEKKEKERKEKERKEAEKKEKERKDKESAEAEALLADDDEAMANLIREPSPIPDEPIAESSSTISSVEPAKKHTALLVQSETDFQTPRKEPAEKRSSSTPRRTKDKTAKKTFSYRIPKYFRKH